MKAVEVLKLIINRDASARVNLNEYCLQENVCGIVIVGDRYNKVMKPIIFMSDDFVDNNQKKICTRQQFQFLRVEPAVLKALKKEQESLIDDIDAMTTVRQHCSSDSSPETSNQVSEVSVESRTVNTITISVNGQEIKIQDLF